MSSLGSNARLFRLFAAGQDAESPAIEGHALDRRFHSGFEVFMGRIDKKPLSQNRMWSQRREFLLKRGVVFVAGTDEDSMPVPAPGFRGFNEQQHLAFEGVSGKSAEHWPGEEGGVIDDGIQKPLMPELLHGSSIVACPDLRPHHAYTGKK